MNRLKLQVLKAFHLILIHCNVKQMSSNCDVSVCMCIVYYTISLLCSCLFVESLTKYKIRFIAIHNAICRHQLETSHFANLAKEMYTSRGWLGFAPHEILRFVKETHIKRKYENSCLFKAFMNMSICASS